MSKRQSTPKKPGHTPAVRATQRRKRARRAHRQYLRLATSERDNIPPPGRGLLRRLWERAMRRSDRALRVEG